MRRREIITLLGGAAVVWPHAVSAQQPGGMRTIGVLNGNANDKVEQASLAAFRSGLAALGWTEGRNVRFVLRYADGKVSRLPALATELVNLAPDAVLSITPSAIVVLKQKTRSIPIVFVRSTDPISLGVVSSVARPGGNITGFASFDYPITTKWLQLLTEVAPRVRRVVTTFNKNNVAWPNYFHALEPAAKAAGISVIKLRIQSVGDIQRFADIGAEPRAGVIVLPDPFTFSHRADIIAAVARHQLPAIYGLPEFTASGGLMSYGPNFTEQFHQAASYVDRILRGTKPTDLPVQYPNKYYLSINLKTANALGLAVPQSLLIQADEVIRA